MYLKTNKMKKIITICAAILMTACVFAQAPNKMSYPGKHKVALRVF
jgi:hypothetical protein